MLSGAVIVHGCKPLLLFGVVVGLLNSECPQQYGAYESKYGAHGQHIELQGKVHGSASLVDALRLARNDPAPKAPVTRPAFPAGGIAYRTCAIDNRLIERLKKSEGPKILIVQNSRDTEFFMWPVSMHRSAVVGAVALAHLFISAGETVAQVRQHATAGQFDFYVLSLSWSPSYCEVAEDRTGGRARDRQCSGRPFAFVVHGFWPQYERGFPSDCQVPAPRLARALVDDMIDAQGDVLYVGKAKNIRKRVTAYARPTGHDSRISRMTGG